MSSAALSTTPCRGLGIQKSEFEGNSARGAGGALFMTHSETVHFDTEVHLFQYYQYLQRRQWKFELMSSGHVDFMPQGVFF